MKQLLRLSMFVTTLFLFSMTIFAEAKHGNGPFITKKYCTIDSNVKSCAHAHFKEYPATDAPSEFLLHVVPADEMTTITDVQVSLWMDMGNGRGHDTGAVTVTPADEENHFNITNALFTMTGDWKIIIRFVDEGVKQEVVMPITIKE